MIKLISVSPQAVNEFPATTVVARGLVTEHPKWKEVVSNHQLYSTTHQSSRQFQGGPVLAYVTPVRSSASVLKQAEESGQG